MDAYAHARMDKKNIHDLQPNDVLIFQQEEFHN
jgi:hypothetical protein